MNGCCCDVLGDPASTTVQGSADVGPVVRALIGTRLTESLVVLALDTKVARGSVAACAVVIADVFRYPLIVGAAAMIIAHNQPSGDVTPSQEDRAITRRIVDASALLGLQVLEDATRRLEGLADRARRSAGNRQRRSRSAASADAHFAG